MPFNFNLIHDKEIGKEEKENSQLNEKLNEKYMRANVEAGKTRKSQRELSFISYFCNMVRSDDFITQSVHTYINYV